MRPVFSAADIAEARRLNTKLNMLPRLRMQTWLGRVVLNALLLLVELYPLARPGRTGARRELRSAQALGRRVKLRIFHPPEPCRGVILDIHGGGWTVGNARMNDAENARLAVRTGTVVVCVDFGLALNNPITSLVDDCEAAAAWTLAYAEQEFGCSRMVIKGSSAGAHIAALTLLRLRDRNEAFPAVKGITLHFGIYDLSGTPMVRRASLANLILHGPTVRTTLCKLTPGMTDAERQHPSISPLYANLAGLPPALFIVGEEDMLFEDSERFEAKWRKANGNSTLVVAPASPHAFNRFRTAIAVKVGVFLEEWITARLAREKSASASDTVSSPTVGPAQAQS